MICLIYLHDNVNTRKFILIYTSLGYSCISVIKWHLLEVVYIGTKYALTSYFVIVDKTIFFRQTPVGVRYLTCINEKESTLQLNYNNRLKFPYQQYMNIKFISYIFLEKLKS